MNVELLCLLSSRQNNIPYFNFFIVVIMFIIQYATLHNSAVFFALGFFLHIPYVLSVQVKYYLKQNFNI